jgi:hypothetical protein
VHTIVSFDFAVGIVPGWHTTVFPPYFVAGAIFSGFRDGADARFRCAAYGLQDFITDRHLDNMAKVMLAAGLIVAYGYLMEGFMAWYSGNYEQYMMINRLFGPYCVYCIGLSLIAISSFRSLLWFASGAPPTRLRCSCCRW